MAKKTVILYDFYNTLEEDYVFLNNMQVVAKVILDKSLVIDVEKIDLEEVTANKYSLAEEQKTNLKIIAGTF